MQNYEKVANFRQFEFDITIKSKNCAYRNIHKIIDERVLTVYTAV